LNIQEASEILKHRVESGGKLLMVAQSDLVSIKNLQEQCHSAGIPTMFGPCTSGG